VAVLALALWLPGAPLLAAAATYCEPTLCCHGPADRPHCHERAAEQPGKRRSKCCCNDGVAISRTTCGCRHHRTIAAVGIDSVIPAAFARARDLPPPRRLWALHSASPDGLEAPPETPPPILARLDPDSAGV
jgi:hypothetical protein